MQVEFDRYSLIVDGQRKLIRSGSLHYFRLPAPHLWRDRLTKMRDAGLNAVDIYYAWNYHAVERGEWDFDGVRDVDRLHDMIEEAGLYLIARPGPYICAEIDFGGLPAWMLREPSIIPRCRGLLGFNYSKDFIDATREWFEQVIPRFATRPNLLLVQTENEYSVPGVLGSLPLDLVDLLIRWFGTKRLQKLLHRPAIQRFLMDRGERYRGQTSQYMRDLYEMVREFGVEQPIFHNDVSARTARQTDVDLMALDRYPLTDFRRDWRDRKSSFDDFLTDEEDLEKHHPDDPVFYPELQAGWFDSWGGPGYDALRESLGTESLMAVTQAALAARGTLWNYYMFAGGVTWGYMSSPDVYTSYDFAAPIAESGRTGPRYEAVRRFNEFLDRFADDLVKTDAVPDAGPRVAEHVITRQGEQYRYVFLRNPRRAPAKVQLPEAERSELAPWETQIRVYDHSDQLVAVSPEPLADEEAEPSPPPKLPRLNQWTFACASPQLDPGYDDAGWDEIPPDSVGLERIDIDSLGVHYGFVWYRGTFNGPLDRLLLDARHLFSVWVNGKHVARGEQFRNTAGLGPDGAKFSRISLRDAEFVDGRNVIVILVESLGHNKGFADDGANPRGIVRMDTGSTEVAWRFRGGLVRGERGMNPEVAFEGVETGAAEEVVLPHGWTGEPEGIGLYETRFELEDIDPKGTALGLAFDPGIGRANLYLNGTLIGRFWPERGPQRRFLLPWGVLRPDEENRLSVAVWKRTPRASLGKLRLEPL